MRWKSYNKEKPTNEEHEYLVKSKGMLGGYSYDIYYWANNYPKLTNGTLRI